MRSVLLMFLSLCAIVVGCEQRPSPGQTQRIKIALNWVPEPEFGGVYAAQQQGIFKSRNLEVDILPGGAGVPTWQLVASGQVEYGIASADEVAIARLRGADIVAIFATYQTCPQAIMVHESRGLTKLEDSLAGGTLALEKGLTYARFLEKQYGFDRVKLVPYTGGVAAFLADEHYAQQCFVFSEPIAARRQGANVKTFLVADSGYNPYTAVVIARADHARDHRDQVDAVIQSLRAGWVAYLNDPKPTNDLMGQLNKAMDAQTFAEAAEAQKPLIVGPDISSDRIGTMTLDRWKELIGQMRQLGVLEEDVAPETCFVPESR